MNEMARIAAEALRDATAERIRTDVKKDIDEIKTSVDGLKEAAQANSEAHLVAWGRIDERLTVLEAVVRRIADHLGVDGGGVTQS